MFERFLLWLGIASVWLVGCSPDEGSPSPAAQGCEDEGADCAPFTVPQCAPGSMLLFGSTECTPVGWSDCTHPFEPDPSGWGCREILPATACPAGTMARIGNAECQPVGWTSCPPGFELDPSGWGCRAVVTDAPCTGAMRAAMGSPVCQPIGDCTAPFPPGDATLFVDDDYTDDELDATHFTSIGAAILAAADDEVIAVEAGSYLEALSIQGDVTIVGRCAQQVVIDGADAFYPGVWVSAATASLSGVTLSGHSYGALAEQGSTLTLRQTVIQDARFAGVTSAYADTRVQLEDCVVRGTIGSDFQQTVGVQAHSGAMMNVLSSDIVHNDSVGVSSILGGSVLVEDSIVRDTVAVAYPPAGLMVSDNSVLTVSRSAILDNAEYAAYVTGAAAKLELSDSTVAGTHGAFDPGTGGVGVYLGYGAELVLQRAALADEAPLVSSGNVVLDVSDAVLTHSPQVYGSPTTFAFRHSALLAGGLFVISGSNVVLDGSLVQVPADVEQAVGALRVTGAGAFAEITDSTIEGAKGWGLWVDQMGSAKVTTSVIRQSTPLTTDPFSPAGVTFAAGVTGGGYLTMFQSAVIDSVQHGVHAADELPVPSTLDATNLVVRGTTVSPDPKAATAGISVGGGAIVTLASSAIVDNEGSGMMVHDAKASASLQQTVVRGTHAASDEPAARGLWVHTGGHASAQSSALVDNIGIGVAVGGVGSLLGSNGMLVLGTRAGQDGPGSRGVVVEGGAQLEVLGSAVVASEGIALQASGPNTSATLTSSILADTSQAAGVPSSGLCGATQDGARLTVLTSRVFGCQDVGLAFFAAQGAVTSCVLDHNHIALHAQDGTAFVGDDDEAPLAVVLSGSTHYVANGERIGAGTLPVPELLPSALDR